MRPSAAGADTALTADSIKAFARHLAENERLAPKTCHTRMTIVKSRLKWATVNGKITATPAVAVKLPQPRMAIPYVPTREIVHDVVALATGSRQAAIAIAAFAGLRREEIRMLRKQDVVLAAAVTNEVIAVAAVAAVAAVDMTVSSDLGPAHSAERGIRSQGAGDMGHIIVRSRAGWVPKSAAADNRRIPIHPDLLPVLRAAGVYPAASGWSKLNQAHGVSLDGNTIVGVGNWGFVRGLVQGTQRKHRLFRREPPTW